MKKLLFGIILSGLLFSNIALALISPITTEDPILLQKVDSNTGFTCTIEVTSTTKGE